MSEEERWAVAETLAGISDKVRQSHSGSVIYLTCDCGEGVSVSWRWWRNGVGTSMAEIIMEHPGCESAAIRVGQGTGYTVSYFARQLCRKVRDLLEREGSPACARWWGRISRTIFLI